MLVAHGSKRFMALKTCTHFTSDANVPTEHKTTRYIIFVLYTCYLFILVTRHVYDISHGRYFSLLAIIRRIRRTGRRDTTEDSKNKNKPEENDASDGETTHLRAHTKWRSREAVFLFDFFFSTLYSRTTHTQSPRAGHYARDPLWGRGSLTNTALGRTQVHIPDHGRGGGDTTDQPTQQGHAR